MSESIDKEIEKEIDDVARAEEQQHLLAGSSIDTVKAEEEEESIDDVAAPPGISKRKIKEEVLDDDQKIDQKKKKVVKEHNFLLVNIQAQGENTGSKAMKALIEKANLDNLKFTPVRPLLETFDYERCIYRISAFTDEDAQLIEERIEESQWHKLFCIDNLQEANPFFWKSLEDEQIVTAILLATYQQNLGTQPTETLSQLLEDKKAILQAMDSGIVMEKLQEKLLNTTGMQILASIKEDMVKDIPELMEQSVPPGDILIHPDPTIIFDAPFHLNRANVITIKNLSARRIAYRTTVSNQTRLDIGHPNGILDPNIGVMLALILTPSPLESEMATANDSINVEWVNTPDGAPEEFCHDWFDAPAITRDRDVPINYIP